MQGLRLQTAGGPRPGAGELPLPSIYNWLSCHGLFVFRGVACLQPGRGHGMGSPCIAMRCHPHSLACMPPPLGASSSSAMSHDWLVMIWAVSPFGSICMLHGSLGPLSHSVWLVGHACADGTSWSTQHLNPAQTLKHQAPARTLRSVILINACNCSCLPCRSGMEALQQAQCVDLRKVVLRSRGADWCSCFS